MRTNHLVTFVFVVIALVIALFFTALGFSLCYFWPTIVGDTDETTNDVEYYQLSAQEIMDVVREEKPTLEYSCPYENSKCVANIEYVLSDYTFTNWDIYLFIYEGTIGTWIVNSSGQEITFYGDAYLNHSGNLTVRLGSYLYDGEKYLYKEHLSLSPDTFQTWNKFMVNNYSYSWETALPQ